uniref:Uncharacterized protein n=1 Tax=Lepeophtheirus salmonis TaxID=72036 RepID=A0A0K2SVZ6_LEPSM
MSQDIKFLMISLKLSNFLFIFIFQEFIFSLLDIRVSWNTPSHLLFNFMFH